MRAAPAVSCARMHKKTHTSIQVQRRQSGFPCAVVYGLFRALLGDRAFLPPSPLRSLLLKNLTPASGRRDHTASPSASARVRLAQAFASTASHRAFVTIASRPSHRVRHAEHRNDLPDGLSEIFFGKGLDRVLGDLPVGLLCRMRPRDYACVGATQFGVRNMSMKEV